MRLLCSNFQSEIIIINTTTKQDQHQNRDDSACNAIRIANVAFWKSEEFCDSCSGCSHIRNRTLCNNIVDVLVKASTLTNFDEFTS